MSKHTKIVSFIGSRGDSTQLKRCNKCGGGFYLNEKIISKRSSNSKKKRYHIKCAEDLNII